MSSSEDERESDGDWEEQDEPMTTGEVLEFGFDEEEKPLSGRRLKKFKEQKKKMRTGTFGTLFVHGFMDATSNMQLKHELDSAKLGEPSHDIRKSIPQNVIKYPLVCMS